MRTVIAVIVGYVVMVLVVMMGIAVTWFTLGAKFAFDGDTIGASTGWSLVMMLAGFIAAIAGGLTAALIAGKARQLGAVKGLVALIVVFGVLTVVMQMMATPLPLPEGKTIENLTFAEAGQYARSPTWYNIGIIVVGVTGVMVGSKMLGRRTSTSTEPDATA
jgi:hypothetical protein